MKQTLFLSAEKNDANMERRQKQIYIRNKEWVE